MAETKADIRAQLKYMRKNRTSYLAKRNPYRISKTEYNKRINTLKKSLK